MQRVFYNNKSESNKHKRLAQSLKANFIVKLGKKMILKSENESSNSSLEEIIRKIVDEAFSDLAEELIPQLTSLILSDNQNESEPGSNCTVCKRVMSGIRFICLECPDYFLCTSCEEKAEHEHNLLKQREENQNSEPKCMLCENPFDQIIFTCTECTDYHLCCSCEENAYHQHDFIKRRLVGDNSGKKKKKIAAR